MRTTLTLMLTILATFCQGECPIECYCDQVTTCTGDKLLTRFPQLYPSSFTESSSQETNSQQELQYPYPTRLELHEYGVVYLSGKDFLEIISNLTELSLTRNSLEEIDNETFSLSSPTFSSTPSRPSKSSTTLSEERHHFSAHLSSSIATVESGVLKLRILDLSQNKLNYFVGGGKLKRLKILDLSSNKLQQVYELSTMANLESVNLRDNRISYLEPSIFQSLRYLQYVNLDSNTLGSIHPSTFSNLPALGHLILSSNPISNLLPGFYWDSRVQFVDVSHVGLTSIPASLTKTVRDFRCANNNLTIIRQTDFESYPNVGLLVLDENSIHSVEDDAFGRLDFLTRLWMNGNRLSRLPQNLPPSLQSLHLEDNRILNLSSGDFKNLRNLQELNLHGNRISSLPPYVFADLISLKNLDLRSNQIDVIYRDSFANLSKLQTLDVSQNPIKVIVTGAFGNLQKVSLLHLGRLMEPIEFDSTSLFSPLQKLQILELDDSPHFAKKLIQESAFSHLPNLIELNLQRCEFEDLNLVSNALSELNLQIAKMSGNPWDCQDLHGSAIHELMSKGVVADHPVCDHPPQFKGKKVASINFNSSLLFQTTQSPMLELEESSDENLVLDFTELTPEEQNYLSNADTIPSQSSSSNSNNSSGSSFDKVTNPQNTNSPENVPHAPIANGPYTQLLHQSGRSTHNLSTADSKTIFSNFTSPSNSSKTNASTAYGKATVVPFSMGPADSKGLAKNRRKDSSEGGDTIRIDYGNISDIRTSSNNSGESNQSSRGDSISDLDTDTAPTKSYFDYSWKSLRGTSSISSSSEEKSSSSDKKPAISIPIGRPRTQSLDKTKTNDDNTIIDESSRRSDGGGTKSRGYSTNTRRRPDDGEETGPKSIDGFPSEHPDPNGGDRATKKFTVLQPGHTSTNNGGQRRKPEAFYLRRENPSKKNPSQTYEPTSGAVIMKTLIISAATCLGSILILLSISYGAYLLAKRRSGVFNCSSVRNSGEEDTIDGNSSNGSSRASGGCTRMSYTRFGKGSRESRSRSSRTCNENHGHNQLHPDGDSDSSDQVELSGITNRLYLENEEIYHIT